MTGSNTDSPSPQKAPRLSVVMATFNRRHILPRALESIFAQDLPANEYELIVVVDGASDGTAEYLRGLRPTCTLRIIEQPNQGQGIAFNRGIAAARGEIVLLMDDDLVLDPSNFRCHLQSHHGDALVVHGPVYVADDSADTFATAWIRKVVAAEIKRWERGWIWPDDANMDPNYSVSRAAFLASGGFDETLRWRHTAELGVRLAKMGLRTVYEPGAIAHHLYVKTSAQLLDVQISSWGREEIALVRMHPELRPHSALAQIGAASGWKRVGLQLTARSPVSPDSLLRPAMALLERTRFSSTLRKIGLRLFEKCVAIRFLRSAQETAGWENLQRDFGARVPVLMYHHVGPPLENFDPDLTVSAQQFEAHIRFLARRGYFGIRPSDWLAWIQENKSLPAKPMLLTFDDAFEDLKDSVFPLLERYGFGGLVFVATNCVGKTNRWDKPRGFTLRSCLTAEQIQYWSAKRIDFGAHSRNHPDLTKLAESEVRGELAGSRADLEEIVGAPVISFAYPFGHYDDAAASCAQAQFALSFTTDDGLNNLRTDRSRLHRNMVYAWDTPLDLEFLVRLGWNPLRSLNLGIRNRLRRIPFLRKLWKSLPRKNSVRYGLNRPS
jgi:GT2 family glycosyltransferase/peptidoglycan/xylan/chitin deacetylase (PgdA/CDA1 family)